MKLELKHLSAYLPYELKYKDIPQGYTEDRTLDTRTFEWALNNGKPILRPMSDLTKEIQLNGEKFIPIEKLSPVPNFFNTEFLIKTPIASSYEVVTKLLELHFDIFGLINKGLAIDINLT